MKTVFLDLDNTVAANDTCQSVEFYEGLYKSKRPIKIVIDAVKNIYGDDDIIIMSRYVGGIYGMNEKIKWIRENLPENFYRIAPYLINAKDKRTKCDYILEYAYLSNLEPSDCIIIDDNKSILQECENAGIKALYPQQVICEYEKVLCDEIENEKVSSFQKVLRKTLKLCDKPKYEKGLFVDKKL